MYSTVADAPVDTPINVTVNGSSVAVHSTSGVYFAAKAFGDGATLALHDGTTGLALTGNCQNQVYSTIGVSGTYLFEQRKATSIVVGYASAPGVVSLVTTKVTDDTAPRTLPSSRTMLRGAQERNRTAATGHDRRLQSLNLSRNWIGQIVSDSVNGSHCLGVDVASDDGYSVQLYNCEPNDNRQYFDNTFGQMRSPVLRATEGPPGCWYVNPAKQFYFDKGQIIFQECDKVDAGEDSVPKGSPQQFSFKFQDGAPAGKGHHIHHGDQCVEAYCRTPNKLSPLDFKYGDCKLRVASCSYDYKDDANKAQLFHFK